eukprot:m.260680 g.260680  ORF g.260680 m.260680 type:complete len:490 (+) comp40436_c0_seq1:265-1734(+)
MHFSIPETRELYADPVTKRGQYTVFHLHCNGVFHCAVRFSQLFDFNEALRKAHNSEHCKLFPPKRFLALSNEQLEDRRIKIEQYWQLLANDPQISSSSLFVDFLLHAQEEVKLFCEEVDLTIYLVNKKSIVVKSFSTDQTDEVLEDACEAIGLDKSYMFYFGLYLVREDGKRFSIVRPLQDFECPYISLERVNNPEYKIQLRKGYWDPSLDCKLFEEDVALNLVYIQAVEDVKLKHMDLTEENKTTLGELKDSGDKQAFVEYCNNLPGYCFYRWKDVSCDYPKQDDETTVSIGAYELRIRSNGKDAVYPVTRMRCWKIASDKPSSKTDEVLPYDEAGKESPLTLAFDYLVAKDDLKWVTLRSSNAIVISMILQLVVDELVRKKRGAQIRRPLDKPRKPRPQVRPRPPEPEKPLVPEEKDTTNAVARADPVQEKTKKLQEKQEKKEKKEQKKEKEQNKEAESQSSTGMAFTTTATEDNLRVFSGLGDDDL